MKWIIVIAAALVALLVFVVLELRPGGSAALSREPRTEAEEPAESASAASTTLREAVEAPGASSEAARESFDLERALHIRGRVAIPAGTPSEPELAVVALSFDEPADEAAARQHEEMDALLDRYGVGALVERASLLHRVDPLEGARWSRRPVAPDGSFEVPVAESSHSAQLYVHSRFLFGPGVVVEVGDATPPPVVLEPELGGRLEVTFIPPADASPADVAALVGLLVQYGGSSSAGGPPLQRFGSLDERLVFAADALPTHLTYSYGAVPDAFPAIHQDGLALRPGETTTQRAELVSGASLAGEVRDASGASVVGVHVRAKPAGLRSVYARGPYTPPRDAQTDEHGAFTLRGLSAGDYELELSHARFLPARVPVADLVAGEVRSGLDLRLASGATLAGRAVFGSGSSLEAAAGATVRVAPMDGTDSAGKLTADAEGRFEFAALTEGPFGVWAHVERGEGAQRAVWKGERADVPADVSELVLELQPTIAVSGRVVDDRGVPVEAFRVSAERLDKPFRDHESVRVGRASPGGDFALDGLTPGTWRFRASASGHAPSKPQERRLPDASELVFVVPRVAAIRGIVHDPSGQGFADAQVVAMLGNGHERGVKSQEDGRFELEGLEPGTYDLHATAEDWAPSTPIAVSTDSGALTEGVILTLTLGGSLTGEVYDAEGAPAVGREVQLKRNGGKSVAVRTDEAGRFERAHLAPGTYQVWAVPDPASLESGADMAAVLASMRTASAVVSEGLTTHVVVGAPPAEPVRVTGRVTLRGEPVAGVMVMFAGEDRALLDGLSFQQTDSEGRFELVVDGPGNYTLLVVDGLESEEHVEFNETIPRGASHHVELALPTGGLAGRVLTPDGRPAAGVVVSWTRAGQVTELAAVTQSSKTRTGADGAFAFGMLGPGSYELRVDPPSESGWAQAVLDGLSVQPDELTDRVEIALAPAGAVAGRVVDTTGAPIGGASVYVRDAHGRVLQRSSRVRSGADGAFRVSNLPAGQVTLSARHFERAAASGESEPVSVPAGGEAELSLVLEPGATLVVTVEDDQDRALRAAIEVLDEQGRRVDGLHAQGSEGPLRTGVSSTTHRIGPLPPNRYRVRATTTDGKSAERPVTLRGEQEKRIHLRPY